MKKELYKIEKVKPKKFSLMKTRPHKKKLKSGKINGRLKLKNIFK